MLDRPDTLPRWSPDGRTLAFVSDRAALRRGRKKEGAQAKNVFVVSLSGGEARSSRPSNTTAVTSVVAGRAADRLTVNDAKAAGAEDDGPLVYEHMRYKTAEGFLSDNGATRVDRRRGGSDPRRLTDGDWDDVHPAWSPDGREIAFVSNRTADRERNTVADVHVAAVTDGTTRCITNELGQYGNPSWSPDGATIACYGVGKALGSASTNVHLWLWPAAGNGKGTDLLSGWDRTVGSVVMSDMRAQVQTLTPKWSADRTRVIFVGSDQGAANVYSVPVAGGEVHAETLGAHQVVSRSLADDAKRFACVYGNATSPGDVAVGELGSGFRCLTDLNGELMRTRHIAPIERVEFKGADGWMVEGWLMKPRGFDAAKKWPLVLEIHGGPHATYGNGFFHEFQVLIGRGYGVLYTNPRGSHAYGEKFSTACVGDWGGKDYEDLMAGVEHALGTGWVDEKKLYVTGGSYGGFMTNWIVGHTTRFRAAATQRSISNNISAFGTSDIGWHFWQHEMGDATPWRGEDKLIFRSPLTYVTNVKTPLLILHAERDLRCPIEQAEQLFTASPLRRDDLRALRRGQPRPDARRQPAQPGRARETHRRLVRRPP